MTNQAIRSAAFVFISLVACSAITVHSETAPERRAASALFNNFETVVYTRTDFISRTGGKNYDYVDSLTGLRLPFLELVGGLKVLGLDTASEVLAKYSAVLVGAKDFAPPEGLGMVSSHKCYIGILDSGDQPSIEAVFRKAAVEFIEGKPVWTWPAPPYEGHPKPTTFYAAQIAHNYFLMTNDRQDFQAVASILILAGSSSADSVEVRGWETFKAHKYWAYRLVNRDGVVNSNASTTGSLNADVIALTFFADVDQREGSLQVFSSDSDMKTTPRVLPEGAPNKLQPQGAGIWQASLPLSKNEVDSNVMFQLFYSLGFGVAL
jgi:hypothetical protein